MTPFEQKLADAPRREIPPEWRSRILENARDRRLPFVVWLIRLFAWPHPLAWGAVAAAWVVIVALNISGPHGQELYAVTPVGLPHPKIDVHEYFVQVTLQRELLRLDEPDSTSSTDLIDRSKL